MSGYTFDVIAGPECPERPVKALRRGPQEPVPGPGAGHDRAGPVQGVFGVVADQAVVDARSGESVTGRHQQGESAGGAEPDHAEPAVTAGLARQPCPQHLARPGVAPGAGRARE